MSTETVAARMVELGLAGRAPKRRRSLTRQARRLAAPDLVRRKFTAVAPDVLWCGDLTQIDTDEGPLYLATVEDLFSRRMLGQAMSAHHDAALVVASLRVAVTTRGGDVDGVIFRTDRGSEYTAAKTADACRRHGITQSMGRVGCALDNAAAEAFNSTLKVGFAHRHHFTTRAEARIKISTSIADFYNRRHSANDGLGVSPKCGHRLFCLVMPQQQSDVGAARRVFTAKRSPTLGASSAAPSRRGWPPSLRRTVRSRRIRPSRRKGWSSMVNRRRRRALSIPVWRPCHRRCEEAIPMNGYPDLAGQSMIRAAGEA
ncbi:IS3 family transposase [Actinoallomurus sp. WRP6H-15]|nr:IS3 family transposase [Actinoallomurus soli]